MARNSRLRNITDFEFFSEGEKIFKEERIPENSSRGTITPRLPITNTV